MSRTGHCKKSSQKDQMEMVDMLCVLFHRLTIILLKLIMSSFIFSKDQPAQLEMKVNRSKSANPFQLGRCHYHMMWGLQSLGGSIVSP